MRSLFPLLLAGLLLSLISGCGKEEPNKGPVGPPPTIKPTAGPKMPTVPPPPPK